MTIDEYFRQHREESDWADRDLCELLDGKSDTTVAANVWASIANGEASVGETLLWAQHVANQIQKTVTNGVERDAAPAALKAIGFYGRRDPYRSARELMETFSLFDVLEEDGTSSPAPRLTSRQWVGVLRAAGHLDGVLDKTAINKVDEWRKELGIP